MGDAGSITVLEDPLEEEMTTHSTILAWKIPETEEPGEVWFFTTDTTKLPST